MTKKIGIFSGTFDPVHPGHISFALDAAKAAGLNKVEKNDCSRSWYKRLSEANSHLPWQFPGKTYISSIEKLTILTYNASYRESFKPKH